MVELEDGRSFSLENYLQDNFNIYKKDVLKKDDDCMIIVDGIERGGKSTMANQIANFLDPTFAVEGLSRTVFTAEQLIDVVKNGEKGQAIIFDEAMGYLNSRQAMSRFNRSLIKVFSEMGFKNLFVIICIPSFFELDRYAAIHRSRALVHIFKNKQGKKGSYCFFNYHKKKDLYILGKKMYNYSKPAANFHGEFRKFFSIDKELYNAKKHQSIFLEHNPKSPQHERFKTGEITLLYIMKEHFGYTLKQLSKILEIMGRKIDLSSISHRIRVLKGSKEESILNTLGEAVREGGRGNVGDH